MSTVGVILSTVRVILSTVRGCHDARRRHHDACGGYYEYHEGCSVSWGKNLHCRHSNGPLGHRMERHTCMGSTA